MEQFNSGIGYAGVARQRSRSRFPSNADRKRSYHPGAGGMEAKHLGGRGPHPAGSLPSAAKRAGAQLALGGTAVPLLELCGVKEAGTSLLS